MKVFPLPSRTVCPITVDQSPASRITAPPSRAVLLSLRSVQTVLLGTILVAIAESLFPSHTTVRTPAVVPGHTVCHSHLRVPWAILTKAISNIPYCCPSPRSNFRYHCSTAPTIAIIFLAPGSIACRLLDVFATVANHSIRLQTSLQTVLDRRGHPSYHYRPLPIFAEPFPRRGPFYQPPHHLHSGPRCPQSTSESQSEGSTLHRSSQEIPGCFRGS